MKPRPDFDQAALARQTYLTIPELTAYLRFPSEHACRLWLTRAGAIPKIRRGRTLLVLRRDVDGYLQPAAAAPKQPNRHADISHQSIGFSRRPTRIA